MEDTIIKKGYYAYQLRVDLPTTDDDTIQQWITKYNAAYWIIGKEVSSLGKPHIQCIIWFEEKQQMPKLRNWWKGKTLDTKQPVSFTSAKKITSLAKYTKKDNNFITNLHPEEIIKIGLWNTKKQKKERFMVKLYEYAHTMEYEVVTEPGDIYTCSHTHPKMTTTEFLCKLLEFYRKEKVRPAKSTLCYLLWREKYWNNEKWVHNNFNLDKL